LQVAGWTAFQTHYFSENLVAPGIELGTSESVARKSDHLDHKHSTPKENTGFSIYLILPAAIGPEVYSASNRNEY
jgi:hypothetical protein